MKSIGTAVRIYPLFPDFKPPSPRPLPAAARQSRAQRSGLFRVGRQRKKRYRAQSGYVTITTSLALETTAAACRRYRAKNIG